MTIDLAYEEGAPLYEPDPPPQSLRYRQPPSPDPIYDVEDGTDLEAVDEGATGLGPDVGPQDVYEVQLLTIDLAYQERAPL